MPTFHLLPPLNPTPPVRTIIRFPIDAEGTFFSFFPCSNSIDLNVCVCVRWEDTCAPINGLHCASIWNDHFQLSLFLSFSLSLSLSLSLSIYLWFKWLDGLNLDRLAEQWKDIDRFPAASEMNWITSDIRVNNGPNRSFLWLGACWLDLQAIHQPVFITNLIFEPRISVMAQGLRLPLLWFLFDIWLIECSIRFFLLI